MVPRQSNKHTFFAARIALLVLSIGAISAAPSSAQAVPTLSQQRSAPDDGRRRGAVRQLQVDRLIKELGLIDDQVAKLEAIDAETRSQMTALRDDASIPPNQKRPKMLAIRRAREVKIKAILTEDQKTKYEALIARMPQRRMDGGILPAPR